MNEETLFAEALGKTGEARARFLDEHCKGDVELRKRLEALLRASDNPDPFLDAPAPFGGVTIGEPIREGPGAVIGPYKLLQQIGEGGMGVVFMAEQTEPVKRKVALKVIKPGMDSRQVIARFEAERQALAMMDHVNIARVFDGGTVGSEQWAVGSERRADASALPTAHCPLPTAEGRPYFVMELVHGVPITRYCDDNHLTPRERLELFVPVCQAIQHAHQKGIIHRDIKPSNVMVTLYDGKPVPKVIDFGVAKATEQKLTERTLFTQYGTMVGTLEYMSPEQAEMSALGVDTRSDIYSLGVLLYELLTGSTPLTHKRMKEAAFAEILRMIKEEEPPRPSTRLSDSGEALASISANRHTEPAKLTKLVRGELDWIVMRTLEKDRNRRYETANAFAADVQRYLADEAVQACPPSAGYRLRKFARRNKAVLATAAIVLTAIIAVAGSVGWLVKDRQAQQSMTRREVESALTEATQQLTESRVAEALVWLSRAEGVLAHGAGDEELRRRVQDLRRDLEMVATLDDVRLQGTEVNTGGGFLTERTAPLYEKAFRDYGIDVVALEPPEAAKRIQARTIRDHLTDAVYDWLISAPRKARKDHLWAVLGLADPDEWRSAFRGAVWRGDYEAQRRLAAQPEFARLRPSSACYLGRQLHNRGETSKALELLLTVQQRYPDDFWINTWLGWCYRTMKPPRLDLAIRYETAAVAIRPRSPAARLNLGAALIDFGSLDEAEAATREAIRLKPAFALAYSTLSLALKGQGKLEEAIAACRKAIEFDPNFAPAHNNLGNAFLKQGKLEAALDYYRKAIELDPLDAVAHNNVGLVFYRQRKLDEAIGWYRKSITLDPQYAIARGNLGCALADQGKVDEAIAACRKAIDLDPQNGKARSGLAMLLATCTDPKLRDTDGAVEHAKKAVELLPQDVLAWQSLGWAQYRAGAWRASIKALENSCKLQAGTGDAGQWIVLALAHAKLAAQDGPTDKEREHHKLEARRRFEEANKQINQWWRDRPGHCTGQAIWDFRAEARALMGAKESNK